MASYTSNATWPFYTLPFFESYAEHARTQSHTEAIAVYHRVPREQIPYWLLYAGSHHKDMVQESHTITTNREDRFSSTGYHPYLTKEASVDEEDGTHHDSHDDEDHHEDEDEDEENGDGLLQDDTDLDVAFVRYEESPPMLSYKAINWNAMSAPQVRESIEAVLALQKEIVTPPVRAGQSSLTEEEHGDLHDGHAHIRGRQRRKAEEEDDHDHDHGHEEHHGDGEEEEEHGEHSDDESDHGGHGHEGEGSLEVPDGHPHTEAWFPIHSVPRDPTSEIVAVVSVEMAWDQSMRKLLPKT